MIRLYNDNTHVLKHVGPAERSKFMSIYAFNISYDSHELFLIEAGRYFVTVSYIKLGCIS